MNMSCGREYASSLNKRITQCADALCLRRPDLNTDQVVLEVDREVGPLSPTERSALGDYVIDEGYTWFV